MKPIRPFLFCITLALLTDWILVMIYRPVIAQHLVIWLAFCLFNGYMAMTIAEAWIQLRSTPKRRSTDKPH